MWKNHNIMFEDHISYVHNGIINPFNVIILKYAEMYVEYLNLQPPSPPPSQKYEQFDYIYWDKREIIFEEENI